MSLLPPSLVSNTDYPQCQLSMGMGREANSWGLSKGPYSARTCPQKEAQDICCQDVWLSGRECKCLSAVGMFSHVCVLQFCVCAHVGVHTCVF